MDKRKQKEKHITDEVQNEFVPSVSIGPFSIGSNVSDYFDKEYYLEQYRGDHGEIPFDDYYFPDFFDSSNMNVGGAGC